VADYFKLAAKLNEYAIKKHNDLPGGEKILNDCRLLHDKLKFAKNYEQDSFTRALHHYTLGLLYQNMECFHLLFREKVSTDLERNEKARDYFKAAYDQGFFHASTRLGTIYYHLGD